MGLLSMSIELISPAQVADRVKNGEKIHLVDVRSPAEFQSVHAEGAILCPLDALNPSQLAQKLGLSSSSPAVLLCASGNRAKKAAEKFLAEGVSHCLVVEGGTKAWEVSGLPVIRGKGVISIERQVRIGAGALILAGVLMGYFIHPGWYMLSGFIGGGLIFAGITDWCGMGLLLAKMPWNQAKPNRCRF
jgi:rhodanese-related sulfurtransferase